MAKGVSIAVREIPALSVDVADLLRRPGASEHVQMHAEVDELAVPLARVPSGSAVDLDLELDALVDGIHVAGPIEGRALLECRRCLRLFEQPLAARLDEVFLYPGELGSDGETYPIRDDRIDLEPAVRDAVVLSLPLHPLCRDDCAGLCTVCGADRNEADCGHAQAPTDIRWNALEQLRNQLED